MSARAVRVQDLPDRAPAGVCLRCAHCAEEWSAWRGDYFMASPDTVMRCGRCGGELALVRKREVFEPVQMTGHYNRRGR